MKGRAILPFLALALFVAGCERKPERLTTEKKAGDWLSDFATAQARARQENKILLIDFTGSDWCPPCIQLHREVFSRPEFAAYAKQHLVVLEVDFPRHKDLSAEQLAANTKLADRFGIDGFPTIILLSPVGKRIGELGYMPGGAENFIAALEKIRASG